MTHIFLPGPNGQEINVPQSRIDQWANQYPGVNIQEELAKARAWLERNPGKRWKTLAGFTNWLKTAAASTTYRKEQDHISDPRQSRHAATRYVHREYNPGAPVAEEHKPAYLAYVNRLTHGKYGRNHGDLTEHQLAAVAGAPMPVDSSLKEHQRCWKAFRALL